MTYTRDEIMAMSAEQLRVAIAKKLGWTFSKTAGGNVWGYFRGSIGSLGYSEIEALTVESEKLNINTDYPHDIAAAWELVEECRKSGNGWCPSIYWDDDDGDDNPKWIAEFNRYWKEGDDYREIVAIGDTAPLAISRAWMIWSENA